MTEEDFGRALAGDAIADATEALLNAVVDFFPVIDQGRIREVIEAGKRVQQAAARRKSSGGWRTRSW